MKIAPVKVAPIPNVSTMVPTHTVIAWLSAVRDQRRDARGSSRIRRSAKARPIAKPMAA